MNRSTCLTLAAVLMLGGGAAQAAAPQRLAACSWNSPGHNPFMGEVVAAVDHYADIPADVRERLKQRMAERRYDDLVTIRRDSIVGRETYDPGIRDMHFGERSVCAQTTRAGWSAETRERGLVYCESGHCILVPTVCRNVSRIDRLAPKRVAEPSVPGGPSGGELLFDPPAAGPQPPDSFAGLIAPPATGLGEGMTPMAGPGSAWSSALPAYGPPWGSGGVGSGTPAGPFGGREPIGGLPPLVLPPKEWPHVPPVDVVVEPPPITPVPEPGTWALMLGGLAVVIAGVRRRRH
jgi:hypothetical protein